jgi:uncharacterized protein (DUF2236 family)
VERLWQAGVVSHSDDRGDTGFFGPGSVTWRVHAEPILWLAGFRALLLQTMHPRALAGVLQNSQFRSDPWGRLWRTAQFYGDVVYGSRAHAEESAARLRRVHARMGAVDPATGARFRVDEPDLLRWVHVTATESFLHTARRSGLRLSAADVDGYYREQLVVAGLVGLDPTTVPATQAEVDAYYADIRSELMVGADARSTALYLALPSFPYKLGWTPVRPLWIGVAAYGFSLLPAWARRMYGLPGLPTTDLTATLTARTLRATIRLLPTSALEPPPEVIRARVAARRAGSRPGRVGQPERRRDRADQ